MHTSQSLSRFFCPTPNPGHPAFKGFPSQPEKLKVRKGVSSQLFLQGQVHPTRDSLGTSMWVSRDPNTPGHTQRWPPSSLPGGFGPGFLGQWGQVRERHLLKATPAMIQPELPRPSWELPQVPQTGTVLFVSPSLSSFWWPQVPAQREPCLEGAA